MADTETTAGTSGHPSSTKTTTPVQFQPYVELLTWGSIDNPELYKNGKIRAKYKHYIAEQIKMEPVGHTSLRFLLPADPNIIKRLEPLKDKGVTYKETRAFVGVKNPDGTVSRQSIPALEIYFSWWPKRFKNNTSEFDTYSDLSNRFSAEEKDRKGSNLVNYRELATPEHRKVFNDENRFKEKLLLIAELRNKLQSRKFVPFDVNKVEFILQLINLCEDFAQVTNKPIDLMKIFKENGFEIPKTGDKVSSYNLNYENGEFDKAVKILDQIYEQYKVVYNGQLTKELNIHEEALRDTYELKGQQPCHTVTLPLTLDKNDYTRVC